YRFDSSSGELKPLQVITTLPPSFTGNSTTSEIAVAPSGRFVYGSNRGHDSIAIFAVDAATSVLTPVDWEPTQGKTPRFFSFDPLRREDGQPVEHRLRVGVAMRTPTEKATVFRKLHERPGAFIIPNPWDAGTAKLLASLGFEALATTSLGYANSLGRVDGTNTVSRSEVLDNCRAIAEATDLPVNADLENGYAHEPRAAAA